MIQLSTILRQSTASIPDDYFHLYIDCGPTRARAQIYRERVYCYELYHQMRKRWPADSRFRLNGEVCKQGHPLISSGAAPDLLVHTPGSMAGNHAIIEVKCSDRLRGLTKDLRTLSHFLTEAGYQRAIYLHYGADIDPPALRARLLGAARRANPQINVDPIELWVQNRPGASAELLGWNEPA